MLAELLSFYRVRWLYEPTSFVLKRTSAGAVAESFTPDFYLPDHRLYLELTTMRQPLVTRKNGKIRRLRELYPSVEIKTLYRRDYERIIRTSVLSSAAEPAGWGATVFDSARILERTASLAREIVQQLRGDLGGAGPLILTAINAEVEPFQELLSTELRALGVESECDRIELSRFELGSTRRRVSLVGKPALVHQDRAVLLIAGATSTGLSLNFATRHVRAQRPIWLETVSLLDRVAARVVAAQVRFRGFEAPSDLLTGFGLTHRGSETPRSIVRSIPYSDSPPAIAAE